MLSGHTEINSSRQTICLQNGETILVLLRDGTDTVWKPFEGSLGMKVDKLCWCIKCYENISDAQFCIIVNAIIHAFRI